MTTAYASLMERMKDVSRLQTVSFLLEWDQETGMPHGGVTARAEQLALIASVMHEKLTAHETRDLLDRAVAPASDPVAQANLREAKRKYDRNAKLPTELVKEIAHTQSLGVNAWAKAKKASDFAQFAPLLSKLVDLKRKVAECIGYETEPYDALLDEYEPGARAADIERVFADLKRESVKLLDRIKASPHKPDQSILARRYPRAQQETLSRRMAEALNYDFNAGRADVSNHPFCTTIGGPGDVRITTRYDENWLPAAMYGTLHETGHALYEQGLPGEFLFTPVCDAVSMGIHESQSLMWENMVGRSKAFLTHHFPSIQQMFPEALGNVSLDDFYGAINTVTPSFIRVEADELTYNLHIVLRFELERAILKGELAVKDVPAVWNSRFKELLGIAVPDDSKGCLQDIHWSMGLFGYFPTYALGKLYAAQFFQQAERDVPDLWKHIAANQHKPLLDWLRSKIHRHGKRYFAHELVKVVTGQPLTIQPFIDYTTRKFSEIYQLRG